MHVETDRALIPSFREAVRFLTITIAPPRAGAQGTSPAARVVRDARLVVAGPTGIEVGGVTNLPAETVEGPDGKTAEVLIRLGDLDTGPLTVVLAVRLPGAPTGGRPGISLRLSDPDQQLFSQPLEVDWTVVPGGTDAAQPVNTRVLVQVAAVVGQRARATALDALQQGDLQRASTVLKAAAEDLRALGAGIGEVRGVADHLDAELASLTDPAVASH